MHSSSSSVLVLLSVAVLVAPVTSLQSPMLGAEPTVLRPASAGSALEPLPGEGFRTSAVLRYRMAGRIRPLLFWFGRDDIGLARITWRASDDGARGYELLVGTDPRKAPRALNRWGFISEEVHGADGRTLALMTGTDSATYGEAEADVDQAVDGGDFSAILGQVEDGAAAWRSARIATARAFSIHDLESALDRIRRDASEAVRHEQPLPGGARPGFLVALAELIDRGAGLRPDSEKGRSARQLRMRYVFGRGVYELSLRDSDVTSIDLDGTPTAAVRSSFEIRTLATGARTRFDILFGTEEELAHVPVAAEWQPRWWLRVALKLERGQAS